MGKLVRDREGEALQRIVRDYPLSVYVEPAKRRLKELEMAIPEADPRAMARMKWEAENRTKVGLLTKSTSLLTRGPDLSKAAKSGSPTMTNPKQTVPLSVPIPASTAATNVPAPATGVNDVTIAPVSGSNSALDTKPDARAALKTDPTAPAAADPNAAKPAAAPAAVPATAPAVGPAAAPANQTATTDTTKKKQKKKKTDKTTQTTKTTASQE
jgi:outer membrane protein assembly factor BamD